MAVVDIEYGCILYLLAAGLSFDHITRIYGHKEIELAHSPIFAGSGRVRSCVCMADLI